MSKTVWVIGAGPLSAVYVDVLRDLEYDPLVIGRGAVLAEKLACDKDVQVIQGGLQNFLATGPNLPIAACVVTGVEALKETTAALINYGVRDVLCEKPGALDYTELSDLAQVAKAKSARCIIGYNRRCYAATQTARQMLSDDGGVISFTFEFTEWSDRLHDLQKGPGVMEAFAMGNSSHVMDLAFFLGGMPTELHANVTGKGKLKWHPSGSAYSGSGISNTGAVFSYIANWDAPGRWGVEVSSRNHRFVFRPMEELWVIPRGRVVSEKVEYDDAVDQKYKHGMNLQIDRFLKGSDEDLCTLQDQCAQWPVFAKIAGYQ